MASLVSFSCQKSFYSRRALVRTRNIIAPTSERFDISGAINFPVDQDVAETINLYAATLQCFALTPADLKIEYVPIVSYRIESHRERNPRLHVLCMGSNIDPGLSHHCPAEDGALKPRSRVTEPSHAHIPVVSFVDHFVIACKVGCCFN